MDIMLIVDGICILVDVIIVELFRAYFIPFVAFSWGVVVMIAA
jgi:hypothetical protein